MALPNSMKIWAMPCHPRRTDHGGQFWQNMGHWKENGKPLQYSCLEKSINSTKRQKYMTLKDELPRSVGAQYATGDQWINRTPGRMKRWRQSKNKTQLWMWLVIEARSDAVKSNKAILHRKLECWVYESRQIGSGQIGYGKSERQDFRHQWTKMDWNGWI